MMGFPLRYSLALLAAVACQTALPLCGQGNVAEQYLLSAANEERALRGIAPLAGDAQLKQAALLHAEELVAQRSLSHQFADEPALLARGNGSGFRYDAVAENIAYAPTVTRIQAGWMASSGHRDNLLNAIYNVVGIAVLVDQGTIYAVEDFGHAADREGSVTRAPELPRRVRDVPLAVDPAGRGTLENAESYLFDAVNRERVQRNLPPLRVDRTLGQAAAAHASEMAAHGKISHQFAGEEELSERGARAGARFSLIAENVAEGPDVRTLHDAWMRSPGHRENILDPAVDSIGIAVVVKSGQLYAVQDFAHSVRDLTLDQQESAVGRLLDDRGLEILPMQREARKTCARDSGYEGSVRPGFIMRYTTASLEMLPQELLQQLATGRFYEAAVGACASNKAGSFASYEIAILLYR